MADTANLYKDLQNALTDFKTFLRNNITVIKPAIQAAKAIFPPVGDLVNKLITLMGQLKTAVQSLDVKNIPGLSQLSTFTTAAQTLLTTAENLLPDQKSNIDSVLSVVNVVGSFPSLDTVKQDILNLITDIIGDLNSLNA
jgi:hypothetical protein